MDIKAFLLITLSIAVYVILGGLFFQFLERKSGNPDSSRDAVFTLELGADSTVDNFLENLLSGIILPDSSTLASRGWSLNFTVNGKRLEPAGVILCLWPDYYRNENIKHSPSPIQLEVSFAMKKSEQWTLYASIFFASTLIATIGYGNIVPLTVGGRIVACVYALFGIPLIGVWATTVGEYIAKITRLLRKRIAIKPAWNRAFLIAEALFVVLVGAAIFIFLPSLLFAYMEGWSYFDGVYYSFISLATIGLGDRVAGGRPDIPGWYCVFLNFWLFFGLGWLSMIVSLGVSLYRTRATKAMNQVANKLKNEFLPLPLLKRRKTYAGKRQVSVMIPKTTSSIVQEGVADQVLVRDIERQISKASSNNSRVPTTAEIFLRSMSINENNNNNNNITPDLPLGTSPRASLNSLYRLAHLPTIRERNENRMSVGSEFNNPTRSTSACGIWMIGGEPMIKSCFLASNRDAPRPPFYQRSISCAHPPTSLTNHNLQRTKWSELDIRNLGSSRKQSINEVRDAGVVVVTDNGIAENLAKQVTLLRPRSQSSDY